MVRKDRTNLTLWLGVGAALGVAGLTGCGGHSSSNKKGGTAAPATTAGTTTQANPGVNPGPGVVLPGPGGVIPGGPGGNPGGLPGGGLPGGGTPGGGLPPPPPPADDHGNTPATATAIPAMNQAVAGRIGSAGDEDWFKVQLGLGNNYSFLVGDLQLGMDSVVRLLDRNGTTVIGENDDVSPTDNSSRFDAPAVLTAGEYYVVVKHKTGTGTGTYAVRYALTAALPPPPRPDDHGDTFQTATQIALGTARAGEISNPGDVDWFKVDLVAGTSYEALTGNLSANCDTILELYLSDGTTLEHENDDTNDPNPAVNGLSSRVPDTFTDGFTPTTTGTYYLAVYHFDPQAPPGDTYEILIRPFAVTPPPADDHGNTFQTGTQITLGAARAGGIQGAADKDYFKVDLTAGSRYEFKTQTLGAGMDTKLTLFVTDGVTMAPDGFNDDATGGAFTLASRVPGVAANFFTPTTTGTHYLMVEHFNAAATAGTYEVVAIQNGAPPPPPPPPPPGDDHGNTIAAATTMSVGTAIAGRIETGGDFDFFKVDLVTGTSYEFATTSTLGTMDTVLTLFNAAGAQIQNNDDTPDPNATNRLLSRIPGASIAAVFTTATNGTFYLRVRHFSAQPAGVGPYEVVTRVIGAPPPPPPPPPPPLGATLSTAELTDVDNSGDASRGDTIKLSFTAAVNTGTSTGAIDPANELDLPVAGNSFGTGATLRTGPAATDITVTLGTNPTLRLTGTFDPARVTAGSASGLAIKTMTVISSAGTGIAATSSGSKDVGSTLTAGFRAAANLVTARAMTQAVTLDDGRVLVTNGLGRNAQNQAVFLTTSEIFDPVTNSWTAVQAISGNAGFQLAQVPGSNPPNVYAIFRYDHTATKLVSGKVLIAGGFGSERFNTATPPARVIEDLSSCFLYDPVDDTFDPAGTGVLNVARSAHYATLLPNGQVLIAGGYNDTINNGLGGSLPVGELFDEATGTFTMLSAGGNDMNFPRQEGTATLVGNKVLFAGGMLFFVPAPQPGAPAPTQATLALAPNSEAYDIATRDFVADAQFTGRRWHDAVKLPSGELIMVGGDNGQASIGAVEKYDPMTNMFAPVGNLTAARARAKAVVVNGNVLVVGGIAINRTAGAQLVTDVQNGELYNVQFNVSESFQLLNPRNSHSVVSLGAGKAMVVGGYMGSTTFYGQTAGVPVAASEIFQIP